MMSKPGIKIDDWFGMILFKLVKSGYGTAKELLSTRGDVVIGMLHYEMFSQEYEAMFYDLNNKAELK